MPTQQTIAPVYRYFTVDLLTNEILAEIPLRSVSFGCALKGAGKFTGKIPITAETDSMNLYNSTMPGNTALYVVRNGKCVWGGIIWARSYEFSSKDLTISASEFTSYLYHRKIWKTWNNQYGGTVTYDSTDGWRTIFDFGSNVLVKPGSTVRMEFFEPENFKYNGYYRVADVPAPTTSGFAMVGGFAVADIASVEIGGGWIWYYTVENHGYTTGDSVTITITAEDGEPLVTPTTDTVVVDAPYGSASNIFRATYNPLITEERYIVDGTAARTLPQGTYNDVTITVRLDTYDYIRTLIDSMFDDFVGTNFPNVYIEPGISYAFDVVSKQAGNGFAIIKTDEAHGITPGQAIQVQDVGATFDGEYEVTDTPDDVTLVYEAGGTTAATVVTPTSALISAVQMTEGSARVTTTTAHGFFVGQHIQIAMGDDYDMFSGSWVITSVPTTTTFTYETGSTYSVSATTLLDATTTVVGDPVNRVSRVEVTSNVVTLELLSPIVYSVGDTVAVAGVDRYLSIGEKALDAPNSKATVQTTEDHGLSVGDTVAITGLSDAYTVTAKSTTLSTVTMTTSKPHNLRVGDSVGISGTDAHKITNKVLASNVATLTTQVNHNTSVGALITVSDLTDSVAISSRKLLDGTATVTTSVNHNFQVNDTVTISGLTDTYSVISKEATKGYVTLTTSRPHNMLKGQKIAVTGVGAPFDGTQIEVDDVTATRIMYHMDDKYWQLLVNQNIAKLKQLAKQGKKGQKLVVPVTVPLAKATGTIKVGDSYYNGQYVVTGRTNTTIEYFRGGEDQPSVAATGTGYKVVGPSVMNGTYTVTARTNTTLSYAKTANNSASAAVPLAKKEDDIQPLITLDTIHSGSRTITAKTPNTFTFAQVMPSATSQTVVLAARKGSIFNGTRTITEVPTTDRFVFTLSGYTASMLESIDANPAYARANSLYNGSFTITAVDTVRNTISYAKTLKDFGSKSVTSYGSAEVTPVVVISSFGPFPGNADIGLGYSSQGYAGINVEPISYRGFELKSVGEALDAYSDNINGFEYRVDCDYDAENDRFTKTFVLIPIDFPDPPAPGEVAPISRYGADKLVFEYPGGNIVEVSIDESAENSATRFFAVGETDLGPDVGPNIGVASSETLLRGKDGRKWPLLDDTESINGVDDKGELYAYAKRYLSEAAPPYTTMNVSLNGSIAPFVGDYKPGDWCALILDDPFMKMRLGSELEPRTDIFVRKISSFEVKVPDGVTFPETVSLDLVAEWEVDTRGE